jgi:flagella basal body P-ring formation protein FlgA
VAPFTAKTSLFLIAMGISASAHAQQFENLDRLDSIVAMSVGANIGEPGGAVAPVDRRLKLAACPQVPQMSGMMFGAAMVECKPLGWRIRVPLHPGGQQQPMASVQPTAYGRPAPVQKQTVVKKGDPVQLIAGGSAFMVTRMMIADEDGAPGDMIRVREDKKSDPVLARVQETGVVRAPDHF